VSGSAIPDPGSIASTKTDRRRFLLRFLRPASLGLVCALIWLTHLDLPVGLSSIYTEASWRAALGYAFSHRWQAGVDYVFTFGPLGYLSTNYYVPGLFWMKLVLWEGAFRIPIAAILTCVVFRNPGAWSRGLSILLLLLPAHTDSFTFVAIVGITAWVLGSERKRLFVGLVGSALLAVFPLVKFSYAIPTAACVLAIVWSLGRTVSWRAGAAFAFAFVASMAAAWVSAGQSVLDFPMYLRRSNQIASTYSEGMSSIAPGWTKSIALALACLLVLLAVLYACAPRRSFRRLAWTCAAVASLFVAYKAGFVRAAEHTPIFFGFTLVAPFLTLADAQRFPPWNAAAVGARLACVALSLLGLCAASGGGSELPRLLGGASRAVASNARALLDPFALRADLEAWLESARKEYSLPRTRAAVGSSTIDMVSTWQVLLFMNDLNWRPRPVFQSYATLTPELMELNAGFGRGDQASEFILFAMQTIDGRLPTSEDARLLQVIARDYEPVLVERGCLLLRRVPRPGPPPPARVVLDQEIAFGETLDLSGLEGPCHLLRLDIRYSAWGRIKTVLDQAPAFYVEIEADTPETFRRRVVPDMMRAEVILNPLIRDEGEWTNWYVGRKMRRPLALRIPLPRRPSLYEDSVHVTVFRADEVAPLPNPDLDARLETSLLETPVGPQSR
jgi:hypothetical protein